MASSIALKDASVRLTEALLDEEMVYVMQGLLRTAPGLHDDCIVITSAEDGRHSPRSFHYVGRALDVRYRGRRQGGIRIGTYASEEDHQDKQTASAQRWAGHLRQFLGSSYQVIVEADHIHIELDA